MKSNIGTPLRMDDDLIKAVRKIKIDRIRIGIDNYPRSDRRITKAIGRLILKDKQIQNTLIMSPLEDDIKHRGGRIKFK